MDILKGVGYNIYIELGEMVCVHVLLYLEKVLFWWENWAHKCKRCDITDRIHVGAQNMLYLQEHELWMC